jgi:hypothetical protein
MEHPENPEKSKGNRKNNFMKNVVLFMMSLSLVSLISCSSAKKTLQTAVPPSVKMEEKTLDYDIEIDNSKKITGTSTTVYFLIFGFGDKNEVKTNEKYIKGGLQNPLRTLREQKSINSAIYNAVENTDIDIIAVPRVTVKRQNYLIFSIYQSEVKGFAGYFKNVKTK